MRRPKKPSVPYAHASSGDAALWAMAQVLYERMEQMAPEGITWSEASYSEREFCYGCAEALMMRPDLVSSYYGWPSPNNDGVSWGS